MKSFMDVETKLVISHLIEEVLDFKAFLESYIGDEGEALESHPQAQQFKFYKGYDGWPLMQFKVPLH